MLNNLFIEHALTMRPEGSLNHLPVNTLLLSPQDPLLNHKQVTGATLVSRNALLTLLSDSGHPLAHSVRQFLTEFDANNPQDRAILDIFAGRFTAIIKTARGGDHWRCGSDFQQALTRHWQHCQTLTISGGLTSHQFGLCLAERIEANFADLVVISSPWGGLTALYGLAQTVGQRDDLLVMDFGATGVKRGIARKYGNRLELLPDLKVAPFKTDGLIRKEALLEMFRNTRDMLDQSMPVAISIACYLHQGHPFDYHSGIYHRLGDDCQHLATDLHEQWLPDCGLQGLALLEHDSTAAALAFRFKHPAMMVTLGTGLGSAPCPLSGNPE
ncbi:MAG: hypothetical protein R3309_07770 [Reinekea sp.]|nr:hypothetical protein [Reinekea sp.]